MKHIEPTITNGTGWADLYEDIASAVCSYAPQQKQEELFEILAIALEKSVVSFPIFSLGEDLSSLDPFTFFASFNWSYSAAQRKQLLQELVQLIGVETAYSPESFIQHSFFVEEQDLRFFSFNQQKCKKELELLWSLFSSIFSSQKATTSEGLASFAYAYDELIKHRVKGVSCITTALHWVCPSRFLPVSQCIGEFVGAKLGFEASFFKQTPHAHDYLAFLEDVRCAIKQGVFGANISSMVDLAQAAALATEEPPATIERQKSLKLLDECAQNYEQVHSNNTQLWKAVKCFQENWTDDAEDFADMLKASLAQHGTLLATSNMYNPYWEILRLARNEPEEVRSAFSILFDESEPLCKRLVLFEEKIAHLYARNRESMIRAFAKRSAHGNYTAVASYLFLRYPSKYFVYSPLRLNALLPSVGYRKTIRIARPESVEQYFEVCELLLALINMHEPLLASAHVCVDPVHEYVNSNNHLLAEDVINATL